MIWATKKGVKLGREVICDSEPCQLGPWGGWKGRAPASGHLQGRRQDFGSFDIAILYDNQLSYHVSFKYFRQGCQIYSCYSEYGPEVMGSGGLHRCLQGTEDRIPALEPGR